MFLLEETSAKAFLESFLPRFLQDDNISYLCIPHEGKQDLEKSIPRKIRAWRTPNTYFIVLRDQDANDCKKIKNGLTKICKDAGRSDTLIRIACRELESWYIGDLNAVERALARTNLSKLQNKAKYRNPDSLMNPSQEILKLVPEYQKISSSRLIGKFINYDTCASTSFQNFKRGLVSSILKWKTSNNS